MKKLLSILIALCILSSLCACGKTQIPDVTTEPSTEPSTEPVDDGMEHFDLNEIDLSGIGELLVERGQEDFCTIQLDGLYTPVILELEGTDIVSISANGAQVSVAPAARKYASIYGNLDPVIYEQDGLIFLNVWYEDIGYTCVLCPNGTYLETFPDEQYSVMMYLDEEERMVQSKFARKFLGIQQWDTGPIDTATGRTDFYYSIDYVQWRNEAFNISPGESYTISDWFELDEIFDRAKEQGLYPAFETLDELLADNARRLNGEETSEAPDAHREEVSYFDELRVAYDYDQNSNLICESFYTVFESLYFQKNRAYDDRNREISGTWLFQGEEAYRYVNTYDSKDRLTEEVWYQGDNEVERFSYAYDKEGGYTETFSQNGQKQYTYTFNEAGELTAHTVYQNGKAVATKNLDSLVKTQLLTDIWFPFIDSDTLHSQYLYNGTVPTRAPADATKTTADDGSYVLIQEGVDVEIEEEYRHEYHYSAEDKLIREIHIWDGVEELRDEYEYDQKGRCILQVTYIGGEKDMTTQREYNSAGQLTKLERTHVTPETYYIYEDGVDKEVTYTVRTETYRYNKQGLLVETVICEDGLETDRTAYGYDSNGYVLPRLDSYQYTYNAEGVLEEIWLLYEDSSAGAALLRSRTVYVTPDNARQLREIMRKELSWF